MSFALLGLFALALQAPAASDDYGAFGFPNPAGTEIIVVADARAADRLRTAICAGEVLAVRFARRQEGGDANRQGPEQFARLKGHVFRVVTGRATATACLLVPNALMESVRVVRTQPLEPQKCGESDERRLGTLRPRKVAACWTAGTVTPVGTISILEYARAGSDALASVMVEIGGRALSIDLPAKYVKDGDDLWRVDDGGKLQAEGIAIPFLIRRGNVVLIPMLWAGSESLSVSLFVSEEKGIQTRQVLADSWYRAPR